MASAGAAADTAIVQQALKVGHETPMKGGESHAAHPEAQRGSGDNLRVRGARPSTPIAALGETVTK